MKVSALLSIRLWVDCPHCNDQMDLVDCKENEAYKVLKHHMPVKIKGSAAIQTLFG